MAAERPCCISDLTGGFEAYLQRLSRSTRKEFRQLLRAVDTEEGVDFTLAADAGVRRLVLFHHEPEHGDADVDGLLTAARRAAKVRGMPAEVLAAQEGMTLTL